MLSSQPGLRVGPVGVVFAVTLFGAVVLVDLSALLSGIDLVVQVGRWMLGTGLCVAILVLTVALVDLTAAIGGTPAHRARAAVTFALAIMVVMFLFVFWARYDGHLDSSLGPWLIELVGLGAGVAAGVFARDLARHTAPGAVAPASAPPLLGLGDL